MRVWLVLAVLSSVPVSVRAQLISPGKLIEAHAEIDRIDSCTSCHTLGKKSVDPARCLDCHRALRTRIEFESGFHATVKEQTCSNCHKDHFGRDFDLVRFDTTAFDHHDAGYDLVKSHAEVTCSTCHDERFISAPDVRQFKSEHGALGKTFLGLDKRCENCHKSDSPHETQFGDDACVNCHDEDRWSEPVVFDHDDARFRLTGKHVDVTCTSCHKPDPVALPDSVVSFRGVAFSSCQSCHTDPHESSMGSACNTCHQTRGWAAIKGGTFESDFDHSKTGFALVGLHSQLTCKSCHNRDSNSEEIHLRFLSATRGKTYPKPVSETCVSCHVDAHQGEMTPESGILECQSCHSEEGWIPSSFDVFRHSDETKFELTGSHLAVLCSSCHKTGANGHPASFKVDNATCNSCHQKDDPHKKQFDEPDGLAAKCESCHTTESWKDASLQFNHSTTDFALNGAHENVVCSACHTADEERLVLYNGLSQVCESCHSAVDPHQGQFQDQTCDSCHTTDSFHLTSFDHSRTRFELEGAHKEVSCSGCHKQERVADGLLFTRFKPLGMACTDCHSGSDEK